MRLMKHDETVSTSYTADVDKGIVLVTFSVKPDDDRNSQRFIVEDYKVDFKDVTDGEVMIMAAKTIVIKRQREFRSTEPSKRMAVIGAGVNVRAFIDQGRKAADPVSSARGKLDKLSKAERLALLKEYAEPISAEEREEFAKRADAVSSKD